MLDHLIVVLCAGLVALGFPQVGRYDRRRFWHPWVNSGLLPLVLGISVQRSLLDQGLFDVLHALLALALVTAGVLAGTGLRRSYLHKAGKTFLRQQSMSVFALVVIVFTLIFPSFIMTTNLSTADASAWSLILASLLLCTSQGPPVTKLDFDVHHRDVIIGHVAPAGWWNMIALSLAALALFLLQRESGAHFQVEVIPWRIMPLLQLLIPISFGVGLGWFMLRAQNRSEVYLLLLASLAVTSGFSVLSATPPLLTGLLFGAVFANVAAARSHLIEGALTDLEQPCVMAVGLLAGLCAPLSFGAAGPWFFILILLVLRWLLRGYVSPTMALLAPRSQRRSCAAGAAGVLILGSLVLLPNSVGVASWLLPVTALLLAWTAADQWVQTGFRHPKRRDLAQSPL